MVVGLASPLSAAETPTPEQLRFFETNIRPLLATHCYKCHGAEKQESNLRLDTYAGIAKGGAAGPAMMPGKPEQSLLITAIGYQDADLKMPPEKKLVDKQIADLREWIRLGAPHPDAGSVPSVAPRKIDLEKGRQFWAFQPPVDAPLPAVKDAAWPQSPIDHFVLAQLEAKGLRPARSADKRTLLRRATFDLTGLPPSPEEVAEFLADDSPQAFARVVDRLLASPRYGERWGRHWLDVARYADSNGLDENIAHGNAWRYRDYVAAAFQNDKRYDRFVVEQLAGDLLPAADPAARHEQLIATGFLSLGPKVLAEGDEMKMEMDIIDEQLDTLGRSVLGLTLGCARCHDHKFDPLLTDDYYGLAGIFKSTRTMEHFKRIARWNENSLASEADLARKAEHEQRVAAAKKQIDEVVNAAKQKIGTATNEADLKMIAETQFPAETQAELKKLREDVAKLEKAAPIMPSAMGVIEGTAGDLAVHIRGSHLTLGEKIPRRFPLVFTASEASSGIPQNSGLLANSATPSNQSGRLQMAQWITDPGHPLTSRVIVNRVWRWRFGQGIVASPDNFGLLGERPINQPLLDWLARRFVADGWSIKTLHRLTMLSSTYQMSGQFNEAAAAADPENRLLWRFPTRRLDAEEIRDSLLAVSGQLDLSMGGSLLHVGNREFFFDHTSKDTTKYDSRRRSIYLPVVRNHLYDVFELFDFHDPSVLSGDRTVSTIAPQALFMLNSDLVAKSCEELAKDLLSRADLDDTTRERLLFQRAYGRDPTAVEAARLPTTLGRIDERLAASEPDAIKRKERAWSLYAQVVLAASEFVYVK